MNERAYTIGNLLDDLKGFDREDPITVIIDDGAEHLDELEEGSVLTITEAGGWSHGLGRTIRVKPR